MPDGFPTFALTLPKYAEFITGFICGRTRREQKFIKLIFLEFINDFDHRWKTIVCSNREDREQLAIHSTLKHFRYSLEGGTFVTYTDPKPLRFQTKTRHRHHDKYDTWALFPIDIGHISGIGCQVADTLSRITISVAIYFETLHSDPATVQKLQNLRTTFPERFRTVRPIGCTNDPICHS